MAKEAGLKTFTTCGHWYVSKIDEYLDYRCNDCISYACFPDPKQAESNYKAAMKSGDANWCYGAGAYANDGVLQEGNLIANRYINGFFLWRARITGIMNWIFDWPMGTNPFIDDFDSSKDACIVYPPYCAGELFIPTLQWEGIREGIDDYKYLYTLDVMIKDAIASGKPDQIEQAKKIRTGLSQMFKKMPWRHTRGEIYPSRDITNGDISQCRQQIIQWIVSLQK
jgi:hypothetical protein